MNIRSLWTLLLALTILPAFAAEIYVSPAGDDAGPGTRARPFATFHRTQSAARDHRATNPEPVTVSFGPGTYVLPKTAVFTPADSGASAESRVRYQAEPGAEVIISGGFALEGWEPDSTRPGVWKTHVPTGPSARNREFSQLWVNGQRAIRARTPNDWEFSVLDNVFEQAQGNGAEHIFYTRPAALAPLQGLPPEALKNVEVVVFHKWDTTRERLQSAAPEKGMFTTTGAKMQGWNKMERNCLFWLENFPGALDAPGEWFLAGDGWLYYRPRPGEDMKTAQVVAPALEQFLRFEGAAADPASRVKHISFAGLQFRFGDFQIPGAGLPPAQAAMNVESAAILVDSATDLRFTNCAVEHVGGTGFWFRHAARDCRVERSRIFDLGVGGLRIGETRLVPEAERTGGIVFDNCIIQSGGRLLPHAVGAWVGHSADNAITHCDIGDFFYTAVSVGWRWGYEESGAKRNRIEYNHLHHLGYRILSDMGGVYTLGPSEGTVVRHNVIHDVYSTRYGGWGLYPDEGSTGILFENNLVYDVRDGCVHQHYGKENIFRNNILAFSEEGQIAITRNEPHLSFTFENNLVYWDSGYLLGYGGWKNGAKVVLRNNLYWRAGGKPFDFVGNTWEQWRARGNDPGSVIADPLFVDPGRRDFRLKPGSPAEGIGFKPFDPSEAGVYGNPEWRTLANSLACRSPYVVPPAQPLAFYDDFEQGMFSPALASANLQTEGTGELITVTDQVAAHGNRSLKIQDAELKAEYNPHFFWDPNLVQGQAAMRFCIRLEAGSDVRLEWRSEGQQYRVGPSLHFQPGALSLREQKVAEIPMDAWLQVEIRAQLGGSENRWDVDVVMPDGAKRSFTGLGTDPGWKAARWLGFSSHGKPGSAYYLDNLQLQP